MEKIPYMTQMMSSVKEPLILKFKLNPSGLQSLFSLGSLCNDVFEPRTSTGSGVFSLLSRGFEPIFRQIVSIRIKTLSKTNLVASRLIKREKGSLPVNERGLKTSLLKVARLD